MSDDKLPQWQQDAERILTLAWEAPVRLTAPDLLRRPGYRNQIVRFAVADAPAGSPSSVIVKTAQGSEETPYDAQSDDYESPAWRLRNEGAGNSFLNHIPAVVSPLNARCWGGDVDAGLLVLEDLGAPNSLADAMQQNDPVRLRDALGRYAQGLGRLHAATMGRENEFFRLRETAFGGKTVSREPIGKQLKEFVPVFCEIAAAQGVSVPAAWYDEVHEVATLLDNPGPYLAFSPGDTCPDNHRLMEDGGFRFFDFEFAGFRHALLDAAYLCVPFPTCWCVNRLPDNLAAELIQTYRTEIASVCSDARDEKAFMSALVAASAYWTVATITWAAKEAIVKDSDWGIATDRQRIPFRLENFARVAAQAQTLPAMAETARALAEKFRLLWPETLEMPLYSAFRAKETSL